MLPNMMIALIFIVGTIMLARFFNRWIPKVANKYINDPMIIGLGKNIISLIVVLIGVFLALTVLNLNKTVTSLLAGAGIAGLALGLAFQDIALNIIAGIGIILRKSLKEGDIIETKGSFGTIVNVRLRTTLVRLPSGQHLLLPNKDLFQNRIKIYTTGLRRVELNVGVSYDADLERVKKIALEKIEGLDFVQKEPAPHLYFKEFGSSSINFMLFFWIEYDSQTDFFETRSKAIMAIKTGFDKHNIDIPFPIRTLQMEGNENEKSNALNSLKNANLN